MKICALSDLHGYLPELPQCDVVCICGDIVPLYIQKNHEWSLAWLAGPFQSWALGLDCKKVLMIWGNHDFIGENLHNQYKEKNFKGFELSTYIPESQQNLLFQNDIDKKIQILHDSSVMFEGVKFYGTPWCPSLSGWAFYKDSQGLQSKFSLIPNDTDILLTHCPPKFGQQGIVLETNWNFGSDFGCEELQDAITNNLIKDSEVYVLSGHVHSGNHHIEKYKNIRYRNVSIKNEDYDPTYKPYLFEYDKIS